MSAGWMAFPDDAPEGFRIIDADVAIYKNPTWKAAFPQMMPIPFYFVLITIARLLVHFLVAIPWARLMLPKKKNPKYVPTPPLPHPSLKSLLKIPKKPSMEQIKDAASKAEMEVQQVVDWLKRARVAVSAKKAELKFTESVWKFLYYTSSAIYGISVIRSKDWLSNTRQVYWYEFPNVIDPEVELYYAMTFAFYCHMLVSLVWFEERKKDYWQMFAHHWVTLALIFSSWLIGLSRIGCVLLVLHDLADPWLEIAKIFSYAEWKNTCDTLFGVFAVVFGITRLVLYPRFVCYPALIEVMPLHDVMHVYIFFNVLLFSLLGLNAFWFALVMRMAFTLLCDSSSWKRKDTRSESDGSEEVAEAEPRKHDASSSSSADGLRNRANGQHH